MRKALAALAAVCLVAACGCLVQAWRSTGGNRHLVPFRVAQIAPKPVAARPVSKKLDPPVPVSVAPPVTLDIPAVGLSAPIVPVGLDDYGQIAVPFPNVAGWYRLGPAPGAVGPAVIVGHVDTYNGPAVFYRLTALQVGDEVDIVRADGTQSRFVITGVTVVEKTIFPTSAVFAPTPTPTLRLITCTGQFDSSTHHYLDSLIAWGVPAAGPPAAAPSPP